MYQCNGFQLGLVVLHILTAIPVPVVPANHDEAIHIWSSYMIHKCRVFAPRKIRRFSLLNGVIGMVFGMVSCKFSLQLIYNHPIRKKNRTSPLRGGLRPMGLGEPMSPCGVAGSTPCWHNGTIKGSINGMIIHFSAVLGDTQVMPYLPYGHPSISK